MLDLGCGFGLFSLYYASAHPALTVEGFDLNARRIAMARAAARRLGLANVRYEVGDVMEYRGGERFDAAYMLDIVHHIPEEAVRPLLEQVAKTLPAGGRLARQGRGPRSRPTSAGSPTRWTSSMDPRTPVRYWGAEELQALLEDVGFAVHRHLMVDVLPYPHVLYIGRRRA